MKEIVKPGYYRHFKGGLYRVLRIVRNATNGRKYEPYVYYQSLTPSEEPFNDGYDELVENSVFVRPMEEFVSEVRWPDGVWRPRWVPETITDASKTKVDDWMNELVLTALRVEKNIGDGLGRYKVTLKSGTTVDYKFAKKKVVKKNGV